MFFFHFFSTLSYLFSVLVLKLCCRNLKKLIWKPNKNFCGENFLLKLCRFVVFADTEFPSDFRRRFSTGLSKVYPECSVESYQQKHTFGDLSNFLHVFGLSVKFRPLNFSRKWGHASQGLQMRNLCIWMIFLRKTTLVVRKSFSSTFELSEKKVRELDQKIPAVFSKENSTFPAKNFARKLFFREYYVFFSLFFDIELSVLHLFAETLLYESQKFDLQTQTKGLWENLFFIKLCSFVIFADIEFPSDFRRSFPTGLSKLFSECSVERYQQKDTFLRNI